MTDTGEGVYEVRSRIEGSLHIAIRETREDALALAASIEGEDETSIAEVCLVPFGVWSDAGRVWVSRSSRGDVS